MNKPRKHAALIHAWADGAEIEYRPAGSAAVWMPMTSPQWNLIGDYRIKPDPLKIAIEALEKVSGAKDMIGGTATLFYECINTADTALKQIKEALT